MNRIRKIHSSQIKKLLDPKQYISSIELAKSFQISTKELAAVQYQHMILDIRDPLTIAEDENIYIIYKEDKYGLDVMRHSMAHLMAQSVKLLVPGTQLGTGPTTENGFFYDFYLPEGVKVNTHLLEKIQKKMEELIDLDILIEKRIIKREEAIELFKNLGEPYKVEILNKIKDDYVSIYTQGDFTDLCRGPHLFSTGSIGKSFKITNSAATHWKIQDNTVDQNPEDGENDKPSQIPMQRIYGIGFYNNEQMDEYLTMQQQDQMLDHKRIGTDTQLFSFHPKYCSGGVFWEEKGFIVYNLVVNHIRKTILCNGYFEVKTPVIYSDELWKMSGHWQNYRENMFTIPNKHCSHGEEEEISYLSPKPMNCPAHITLFKSRTRSYRDLPMRMAEFGCCFRNESSGSLDGLMRMREFTQDDAHIFCEFSQVKEETKNFCVLLEKVYKSFGFDEIKLMISTKPNKSLGSEEQWKKSENALIEAIEELGLKYSINHGDGAFYGPKLEFSLKDRMGRYWQCGTFQLDFVLPQRMEAYFTNSNNQEENVIICHRAILGSMERFLGILIENNEGHFPFWLAPVQICILPISEKINDYGDKVYKLLNDNYRAKLDNSNQQLSKKIRNCIINKIPVAIVLGAKEMESSTVTIQTLIGGKSITVDIALLSKEIANFTKDL